MTAPRPIPPTSSDLRHGWHREPVPADHLAAVIALAVAVAATGATVGLGVTLAVLRRMTREGDA